MEDSIVNIYSVAFHAGQSAHNCGFLSGFIQMGDDPLQGFLYIVS